MTTEQISIPRDNFQTPDQTTQQQAENSQEVKVWSIHEDLAKQALKHPLLWYLPASLTQDYRSW
jgi:hypothetical protein